MTDWTTQFSLPAGPTIEAVFDTVVTAHGSAVASWLVDKHAGSLARVSDGLVELIRGWIATQRPSLTAWDISFGRAHLALKESRSEVVEAAVRIGLRISTSGQVGQWQARLPTTSLLLDDRVVEGVVQVEVDGRSAEDCTIGLHRCGGERVDLRRDRGSWSAQVGTRLESVGKNQPIYLLPSGALPLDEHGGEIFKECRPVGTITPEMIASFRDGVAVLERNTPHYIPWVERVLRGIVVCPQESEFRLISGSWEDVPGFIHMSSPHAGIEIAEILVHECAHQYFYMLQRVGPIDDSTDTQLYWSPPIRKKRPLSRILMAYHALANVQLLYKAVLASEDNEPRDIEYVELNEPELQVAIRALDEPLRGNRGLTRLGRGLYEPLAEHMAALSVTPPRE